MKNKFASLMVLSFSCFIDLLFPVNQFLALAQENSTNPTQTGNQYPPDYIQNYMQECIKTSMEQGLVQPDANKLCNCTIKQFQARYTLDEFKQLTAKSKKEQMAADALVEVGESCLETILYE
jgi:hypothetical protein